MFRAPTALLPLLLCGCSAFTPPYKKPIISDHLGSAGFFRGSVYETLATTADRRVILVRTGVLPKGVAPRDADSHMPAFCAEPAPEAVTALTTSLGLAASGTNKVDKNTSQEAKLELASAFAQEFKPLAYRTQGLALFRDFAFANCQLWIQGKLADDKYADNLRDAFNKAIPLIERELPLMPAILISKSSSQGKGTVTSSATSHARAEPSTPAASEDVEKPGAEENKK